MNFHDFERHAHRVFNDIPEVYREGIDGLTVRRGAPAHPDLPGVYTLGECLTEEHVSDFGSADTTRSVIALYWGSFQALSRQNPDFDWETETWETLTHELRHHLESLAREDALEDVDYAADEMFKRLEGRPFDPWYYQRGDEVADGVFQVERSWYLEQEWSEHDLADAEAIDFIWNGRRYTMARPPERGDVHYILVHGLEAPDAEVEVVLVRRRGWWGSLRRLFGAMELEVIESEADAEPVDEAG